MLVAVQNFSAYIFKPKRYENNTNMKSLSRGLPIQLSPCVGLMHGRGLQQVSLYRPPVRSGDKAAAYYYAARVGEDAPPRLGDYVRSGVLYRVRKGRPSTHRGKNLTRKVIQKRRYGESKSRRSRRTYNYRIRINLRAGPGALECHCLHVSSMIKRRWRILISNDDKLIPRHE